MTVLAMISILFYFVTLSTADTDPVTGHYEDPNYPNCVFRAGWCCSPYTNSGATSLTISGATPTDGSKECIGTEKKWLAGPTTYWNGGDNKYKINTNFTSNGNIYGVNEYGATSGKLILEGPKTRIEWHDGSIWYKIDSSLV